MRARAGGRFRRYRHTGVEREYVGYANETAADSPAPGGGSISAYAGAMGAALGTMVANLSAGKRGWEDKATYFSDWAVKGQQLKDRLLFLVDEDTRAFNKIMDAFGLPKNNDEEKAARTAAIQEATKYAVQIPFQVMETAFEALPLCEAMVKEGNPNSLSDGAVGALCLRTAIEGAYLNVRINAKDLKDREFAEAYMEKAKKISEESNNLINFLMEEVGKNI